MEIVPYLGSVITLILALLSAATVDLWLVLPVLIFYLVATAVKSHVVAPVLYGRALGLRSGFVLLALVIGLKLGGIIGVFFAVPAAVILSALAEEVRTIVIPEQRAPAEATTSVLVGADFRKDDGRWSTMNRSSIALGRIGGIPIGLDYSWFLIFALLTWTLAVAQFPVEYPGWPPAQYWIVGAAAAILLFVSVLLHELGHSVVAIRYKIPVRSITLFIFGGVAQIGAEPPSAAAEFWIAIAGPVVSFALAIFFGRLQPVLHSVAPLLALATYLAYINGALAVFNLIPGFPLDGGRVLRAVLWGTTHNLRRATLIAANVGRVIAFLFMAFAP